MSCGKCNEIQRYPHTLTVEQPGTTKDAAGHVDLTDDDNWEYVGRIKARFITRGGKESYVFKQTQATSTHVIEAMANSTAKAIDPSWRLKFGTRIFEINAVNNVDEMNKVIRIEATEPK